MSCDVPCMIVAQPVRAAMDAANRMDRIDLPEREETGRRCRPSAHGFVRAVRAYRTPLTATDDAVRNRWVAASTSSGEIGRAESSPLPVWLVIPCLSSRAL